MLNRIIVAVDGSEHSKKAIQYTINLANKFQSEVWVVHAFSQISELFGYDDFQKIVSKLKGAGQVVMDDALKEFEGVSFKIHEELLQGPAAQAILTVAQTRKADMIVMGTRGMGAVKGFLFGSVSSKIVQHAPCTVMVVR